VTLFRFFGPVFYPDTAFYRGLITVVFLVGLAGVVYEIVVDHGNNPALLVLFGAMVGLPRCLRARRTVYPPDSTLESRVMP
jgi:hypothetical protein